MELLLLFGGFGVALLVACLLVREATEQRLAKLRTQLMTLRARDRVLEERIKASELAHSQVREALLRIARRREVAEQKLTGLYDKLGQLYRFLRDEDLPELEEAATSATPVAEKA